MEFLKRAVDDGQCRYLCRPHTLVSGVERQKERHGRPQHVGDHEQNVHPMPNRPTKRNRIAHLRRLL